MDYDETNRAAPADATPAPKKRVRATIADTVAIGKALEDHVFSDDDPETTWAEDRVHSYAHGWSDERIARGFPHLATHHVTAVREALYPKWDKRPAEMTVEDRLAALEETIEALRLDTMSNVERLGKIEEQLEHYVKRRLDAIDREVDGPKIGARIATIEAFVLAHGGKIA